MYRIQIQKFNRKTWENLNEERFESISDAVQWIYKNKPDLFLEYNVRVQE